MINSNNRHFETEVKFFIKDIETLRNRLLAINCTSKGRAFETNIRFDDKNNTLLTNKSLLRLRRDNHNHLTFKSTPTFQDKDVKIMTEYEVQVSDHEVTQKILASLGFMPVQQYDKWRETFVFGDTQILLDALPYGDFMEIEGEKEAILTLASKLDLDWSQRILLNYLVMFEIIKDTLNLPFTDVTFDNFSNVQVDMSAFLPLFYPNNQTIY